MSAEADTPLASCIMPTANRRRFVPAAIAQFLAQDYPNAELVILDDGDEPVGDLIPSHPALRYLRTPRHRNLGAKRNAACEAARGDIILHWDDDDWYAPHRIRVQVEALTASGADMCGIDRALFFDPRLPAAWEYVYPAGGAPWVCGATLCFRRAFWRERPFPDTNVGEDACFAAAVRSGKLYVLPDNRFFVALVHAANTSPKQVRDPRWQKRPVEAITAITGGNWPDPAGAPGVPAARPLNGIAVPVPRPQPGGAAETAARNGAGTALVAAAHGIGDFMRVTPLIRVLARLGHRVDFLMAADYPDSAELFRAAREINRIIVQPAPARMPAGRIAELADATYEFAAFTHLAAPWAARVAAKRQVVFDQQRWLSDGDYACAELIARELGWQEPMPPPFAVASSRRFDVPSGTVVLHPGCKPNWPWKRWHGFAQLAALLPDVAIIGTEADRDNSGTYFPTLHGWPAHARDYTGTLNLQDTAALIAQSAALVSNDSGMMHLGVAVGTPTFGIFGITNPRREIIPAPHMRVITKGLPCEPGCRTQPWGRRDCEHHLQCLKTLSAGEVAARIEAELPTLQRPPPLAVAAEPIRLNYYGAPFDASGYGQAARMYIRALHAVGVKVSVIDTGARPAQVSDDAVAALLGRDSAADFHLFHGIPPYWAHMAFSLRNVIAMTVWETDKMPDQWRSALVHAVDVWLPCNFNVDVFARALERTPFRLPHAVPDRCGNGAGRQAASTSFDLAPDDFVFYSIFEWQDRKYPDGIIEAFLRAFPEENDAVLLLKSSRAAHAAAAGALTHARRRTGSRGRVILRCEAWDEATLDALHARGDCYVSLHKGEGWGYPLFEAACRGTPVVATAYSGPLDYLDADHHWLVRSNPESVSQRYAYYHSGMRWAEPDIAHASEGMAWVHRNRDAAKARAMTAARKLQTEFSVEQVGALAKARLIELRDRANPPKPVAVRRAEPDRRPRSLPIPGDWFDADYFEHGLKSNWDRGYHWPIFKSLFEDTAAYLAEMFPDAKSFLDAGCAKGFLVKALRQHGFDAWGFDHSPWAITRVEDEAKPFVRLADTAGVDYDRKFDVMVAMSLFEAMTEEQIAAFLTRARAWTGQALFATIPTMAVGVSGPISGDRDLSHITLRDREWWLRRFRDAGWRQDSIHRAFERTCQTHLFPTRMGWTIYVFSPG